VVLGNKISRFFKGVKDKFNSFAKKQTTDAIRKDTTEKVSEIANNGKRQKGKRYRISRWTKLSWISKIYSLTFNGLGKESRIHLAKNWFGTFSPVGRFNFKRGSRDSKNSLQKRQREIQL
jgi:hypothetical protein